MIEDIWHLRCPYGMFGREITKYTVIYGSYIHTVVANPKCNLPQQNQGHQERELKHGLHDLSLAGAALLCQSTLPNPPTLLLVRNARRK